MLNRIIAAASILPLLSLAAYGPAKAQFRPGGDSFVAETSAKPGCRAVVLHILRSGDTLSGVVFFKDGSGVSSVSGSTNGHQFQWTMTSTQGQGPVGQVTGTVTPVGSLEARLNGTNCTLEIVVPQYTENGG